MSEAETEESTMAAPPRSSKATGRASEEKWGAAVMKLGFCIVPSLLLRAQRRLKLNPTQLAVLMQLCDYWWDPARKPYPSKDRWHSGWASAPGSCNAILRISNRRTWSYGSHGRATTAGS